MKPTIRKHKTVRGRITGYSASIGPIASPQLDTPAKASEACETATAKALARLDKGARLLSWQGHQIVIAPTVEGWSYWLDTSAQRFDFTCHMPNQERGDVEDAALFHLAQNLWSDEVDDDAFLSGLPRSVQDELRPWIRFQRGYKRLRELGMSDVEAHQKAASL